MELAQTNVSASIQDDKRDRSRSRSGGSVGSGSVHLLTPGTVAAYRGRPSSSAAGEAKVTLRVSELVVCRDAVQQAHTAAEHMERLALAAAEAFGKERSKMSACVAILNRHLGIHSQTPF